MYRRILPERGHVRYDRDVFGSGRTSLPGLCGEIARVGKSKWTGTAKGSQRLAGPAAETRWTIDMFSRETPFTRLAVGDIFHATDVSRSLIALVTEVTETAIHARNVMGDGEYA